MKTIVTEVSCINDMVSDYPGTFVAELTDDEMDRIQKLNHAVKAVGAWRIEVNYYSAVWSNRYIAEEDFHEGTDPDRIISRAKDQGVKMGYTMLVVDGDGFHWHGVVKHCDESMAIRTPSISLDELNSSDLYLAV